MSRRFASTDARWVLAGCFLLALGSRAYAHVDLDAPNGGESFDAGSDVTIRWHVATMHNTLDWDLWYSLDGPNGPWIVIAEDLPRGDINDDAEHSFVWTVPNTPDNSVWIRVRQDNGGKDYFDESDAPFAILAGIVAGDMNCDGLLSVSDISSFVLALTDAAGYASQFPDCDINAGDLNSDGNVSVADIGLFVALLTGM